MLDNTVFSSTMQNGQDYSVNSGEASKSCDINSEIKRQYREYHIDSFGDLPDEGSRNEAYDDDWRARAGFSGSAHEPNDDKGGPVSCDTPLRRYEMKRTGLFYYPEAKKQAEGGDEEIRPIWLSPQFEVLARTQDANGNWGKLLCWKDHNGAEIKWVMPARLLGGHRDELWQALYERGLEISSATGARNLLLAYLTHANPRSRANVVSRTGCTQTRISLLSSCRMSYMAKSGARKLSTPVTSRAVHIGSKARLRNGGTELDDLVSGTLGSLLLSQLHLRLRRCTSSEKRVAAFITKVIAGLAKPRHNDYPAVFGVTAMASTAISNLIGLPPMASKVSVRSIATHCSASMKWVRSMLGRPAKSCT